MLLCAALSAAIALVGTCPADLDGSNAVNAADLGILLGAWGDARQGHGLGDLDGDGAVDASDLGILLGAWGACPPPSCDGAAWMRGFTIPGTSAYPNATALFDDGGGIRLYVGGSMTAVGGTSVPSKIASWNGKDWQVVPGTVTGTVQELIVHDDGSGPALHVAGSITSVDGQSVGRIARWNGTAWSTLGAGVSGTIFAMTVVDDGGGPALYAGGSFTSAGGAPASRVARWNGVEWSPLGTGVNDTIYALCVHDDGSGPALYAGGDFTVAGGVPASRVARWDGNAWSALGTGASATVRCLRSVGGEAPSASGLLAGGLFTTAGGLPAFGVARWSEGAWSALGAGPGPTESIEIHDDGFGPEIHAGGTFTNGLKRWNEREWVVVDGGGTSGSVTELITFDPGEGVGTGLYASGLFELAGGQRVFYIARHDATGWRALGNGVDGVIFDIAEFDDGSGGGPAVVITGNFDHAGGVPAKNIARWDGDRWTALGTGLDGTTSAAGYALQVVDDGNGPSLFVGGTFSSAGGTSAARIARWDGRSWSALGSGITGQSAAVYALAAFDAGRGTELFVGGAFASAGGIASPGLARWNGVEWSADSIGGGVAALRVLEDVTTGVPTLYAGSGGAVAANDGSGWTFPLLGFGGSVTSFARFEDAKGPKLVIGGSFTSINGASMLRVAQWDGTTWAPLGGGMTGSFDSTVWALEVFDEGDGPRLHAGGAFRFSDGVLTTNLASWDGTFWSAVDGGVGVPLDSDEIVYSLLTVAGEGAPDIDGLYCGGTFTVVDGAPGANVAVRRCAAE